MQLSDKSKNLLQFSWSDVAAVAIPLALCLTLTIPLMEWVVDDAAISFVYSRNLAAGNGLVSQPGVPPVEGYSNFLWVLLMSLFYLIGLFDPFITSKVVSFILVAATFWILHKCIQTISGTRFIPSLIVLLFLAFNTSFVFWTCSGLENPLYALLVSTMLYLMIRYSRERVFKPYLCVGLALTAVGAALTRPDGVIYLFAFPIVLFLLTLPSWRAEFRNLVKALGIYLSCYVVGYGGFILFRWLYFNDLYPNTYYVKGGPALQDLLKLLTFREPYLTKFQDLFMSLFGPYVWIVVPLGLIIWTASLFRRKERWRYEVILLVLTSLASAAYLLLNPDWMGEYRFATPLLPLLLSSIAVFGNRMFSELRISATARGVWVVALVLIFAGLSILSHVPRLKTRYGRPRVSFTAVTKRFGDRYNRYAEYLKLDSASFLVPDVGGALYYSKLRIYDLGGLCDRTIAKTRRKNQPAFYEYIFEEAKPTFIYTSGFFTIESRFDDDERFSRDYVAIEEFEDEYAGPRLKRKVMSGAYVRKDAVEGKEEELAALREGHLK